ncbi:ComF family protein [Nitratifractor sp.]|uniref:ComF family protein n=1 Tax=Nitratifractor sp. TaxID=2268144 RepID=UPI0025E98712|nr:ComF family protein [Nitratifractor sp.]
MRCLSCQKFSTRVICRRCHERLFQPSVSTRKAGSLDVISLFGYRSVSSFILSKHYPAGYRIYRYFAREHFAPFLQAFSEGLEQEAYLIGIDGKPAGGYAHTAVLSRYAAVPGLRALPASLIARHRVDYAGKSLQFRLENPRDFEYRGPRGIQAILIDDLVTTGSTLAEAHRLLQRSGVEVLFALVLADARY